MAGVVRVAFGCPKVKKGQNAVALGLAVTVALLPRPGQDHSQCGVTGKHHPARALPWHPLPGLGWFSPKSKAGGAGGCLCVILCPTLPPEPFIPVSGLQTGSFGSSLVTPGAIQRLCTPGGSHPPGPRDNSAEFTHFGGCFLDFTFSAPIPRAVLNRRPLICC